MNTATWPSRFGSALAAFSTPGRREESFFASGAPAGASAALASTGFLPGFGSSALAVSGLAVSGLAVSGLAVSGLAVSGLAISGLAVSGVTISVFATSAAAFALAVASV